MIYWNSFLKLVPLGPGMMISIKRYLNEVMRFWHDDQELAYHSLARKPLTATQEEKYKKKLEKQ